MRGSRIAAGVIGLTALVTAAFGTYALVSQKKPYAFVVVKDIPGASRVLMTFSSETNDYLLLQENRRSIPFFNQPISYAFVESHTIIDWSRDPTHKKWQPDRVVSLSSEELDREAKTFYAK